MAHMGARQNSLTLSVIRSRILIREEVSFINCDLMLSININVSPVIGVTLDIPNDLSM